MLDDLPISHARQDGPSAVREAARLRRQIAQAVRRVDAEAAQRRGQRAIAGGFWLTLAGVALFVTGCLAGPPFVVPAASLPETLAWMIALAGPGLSLWAVGAATFLAAALAPEPEVPVDEADRW